MKKSKKLVQALLLGLSLTVLSGCGLVVKTDEAKARDKAKERGVVVAEGDRGIKVTMGDVLDGYEKMLITYKAQFGEEALKSMADSLEQQKIRIMDESLRKQILNLKAQDLKISKDSDAIKKKADEVIANFKKTRGEAGYKEAMTAAGYTEESYRAEVLDNMVQDQLVEEVTKDLKATETDINAYYAKNKLTSYRHKPGADVFHIFFGKKDEPDAKKKAEEAKAKLDKGAAFADIAKEYGKDTSAQKGGFLDFIEWDSKNYGEDFVKEAKKLKNKEISAPVLTSFGWHIIMVDHIIDKETILPLTAEIRNQDGKTITVKDDIQQKVLSELRTKRMAEKLDEWEKEYHVVRHPERIPMKNPPKKEETTQPSNKSVPNNSVPKP